MLEDVLIHPKTKSSLETFASAPSHALILLGPQGSGKYTLAQKIAANLLNVDEARLDLYPHFLTIEKPADKTEIIIDQIRELNKTLSLQVPGGQNIRRVVIVKNAHHLGLEAQNAFLKTLEEPPAETVFILTANSREALLPTVVSRTTQINVFSPGLSQTKDWFKSHSAQDVVAAWNLGEGATATVADILSGNENQLAKSVNAAKQFLAKDAYNRFIELEKLSKNKEELSVFLEALARVIKALYRANAAKNQAKPTKNLVAAMKNVMQAQEDLRLNVSPKFVICQLALNLHI